MKPKTYFVAWQAPRERAWFPIGRLTRESGLFRFAYTNGAEQAEQSAGFRPLRAFPDLRGVYLSDSLFPPFSNRLPSSSRPDFKEYIHWLNMTGDADDPLVVLSNGGGQRMTDSFEVFPLPEPNEAGEYHIRFFAHGLRYFPPESIRRIGELKPGDKLLVAWDWQNPHDPSAMMLRTNDVYPGDRHLVGYCPRYLTKDVLMVFLGCCGEDTASPMCVSVQRVNPPPAPLQLRLLCALTACWPEGFAPFSGPEYEPLVADEGRSFSASE